MSQGQHYHPWCYQARSPGVLPDSVNVINAPENLKCAICETKITLRDLVVFEPRVEVSGEGEE
jgi:hypothetical protein